MDCGKRTEEPSLRIDQEGAQSKSGAAAGPAGESGCRQQQLLVAPSSRKTLDIQSSPGTGRSICRSSNASTSSSCSTGSTGSTGSPTNVGTSSPSSIYSASSPTSISISSPTNISTGSPDISCPGHTFFPGSERSGHIERRDGPLCRDGTQNRSTDRKECSSVYSGGGPHISPSTIGASHEGDGRLADLDRVGEGKGSLRRRSISSQSSSGPSSSDQSDSSRTSGDTLSSASSTSEGGTRETPAGSRTAGGTTDTPQQPHTSAAKTAEGAQGPRAFHFRLPRLTSHSKKDAGTHTQQLLDTPGRSREGSRAEPGSGSERTEEEVSPTKSSQRRSLGHHVGLYFSGGTRDRGDSKTSGVSTEQNAGASPAAGSKKTPSKSHLRESGKELKSAFAHALQPHRRSVEEGGAQKSHSCSASLRPMEDSSGAAGTSTAPAGSCLNSRMSATSSGSWSQQPNSVTAGPSQGDKQESSVPRREAAAPRGAQKAEREEAAAREKESAARRFSQHRRQRSASHPASFLAASQPRGCLKNGGEEAESLPGRETVSSHWLWGEFFRHALHISIRGGLAAGHRAAGRSIEARQFATGGHLNAGEETSANTSSKAHKGLAAADSGDASGSSAGGITIQGADSPSASIGGSACAEAPGSASYLMTIKSAETPSTGGGDAGAPAEAVVAARTANYLAVPSRRYEGRRVLANDASAHSAATTLLLSAVLAVKSLPYRLRREWKYLVRAQRNTAHINHTKRVERAALVQDEIPSALCDDPQQDSPPTAGSTAAAAKTEKHEEQGAAAQTARRRTTATSQPHGYADGLPSMSGRYYPKCHKERTQELQDMLQMRQVLPTKETRIRLLQHLQRNINKGRRDFEQASPLLSLREEQVLPCGSPFVVRCLEQDSGAPARIERKFLTAGRLIGGGSEALVFAAVETPPAPASSPFAGRVRWGEAAVQNSRPISAQEPPSPPSSCTAAARAAAAARGTDANTLASRPPPVSSHGGNATTPAADSCNGGGAAALRDNIPNTSKREGATATQVVHHIEQEQQKDTADSEHDRLSRGRTVTLHPCEGQDKMPWPTQLAGGRSAAAAGRAAPVSSPAGETSRGRVGQGDTDEDEATHGRSPSTRSSSRVLPERWGRCWALKWFLCESFLQHNRIKAEQEGTVVDWLQMAFWRLVPSHSVNADVVDHLGIAAPHWIGFIEGLPLVSAGDPQFCLLNRVAAIPLMLGDFLTVPPAGLTTSDRLYCIMRLIQVVANMHAMAVLHNDIKLENILIGTDGTLCIGDLGTVTPFTGRPTRFQRIGTDVYLDPQTAQHFLDYEDLLSSPGDQQLQAPQNTSKSGAPSHTGLQRTGAGSPQAATPQQMQKGRTEAAMSAVDRTGKREDGAGKRGCTGTAGSDDTEAGTDAGEDTNAGIHSVGGATSGNGGDQSSSTGGKSVNQTRGETGNQTRDKTFFHLPQNNSPDSFRVVYTPMRDAWAAGIVCYYIWCGGLLPYNLHRAFGGDITGQDLFRFLACLPSTEKSSRLLFPIESCPEGDTIEMAEVRRIIQGLLEPDGALRKTPLEIVRESPLFSAYRADFPDNTDESER